MKRLLIIVGLVVLAAALVFLNQGVKRSATPDQDEDEQAQQSKAQPTQKPPPSTPADLKVVLPPDETVGNPATARHHIEAGWVYDEANQQKPETITVPIQTIRDYVRKSGGIASAEIVNLDIPAEDRAPAARTVTELGIRVDGQPVSVGNLSGTPFPDNQLLKALEAPAKRR